MRASTRAAAVAVAACCALAITAGAAHADPTRAHPDCSPPDSERNAAGQRAVIFTQAIGVEGDYSTLACDLLTGNQTHLSDGHFRGWDGFHPVAFAGRRIAFVHSSCTESVTGGANCSRLLRSLDVKTGSELTAPPEGDQVTDIAVSRSGYFAWVEGGPQRGVRMRDSAGPRLLEAGPVAPDSLSLSRDGRVYWTTAGGLPRSARLEQPKRETVDPAIGGSRRCHPRGARTLAANERVRVYERIGDDHGEREVRVTACDLRKGRRTGIATFSDPDTSVLFDQIRVAGPFVAHAGFPCGRASCGVGPVRVIDARTGRTTASSPLGPSRGVKVTDLVLGPDGAVAWARAERGFDGVAATPDVHRCSAGSCVKLDEGDGIEPRSLALSDGGRLYWTRDGQPRAPTPD